MYFWNVASQSIWLTSFTFTSDCEALNASVSFWSVASFSRGIQCHIVISTGFEAFFSALNGQVVLFAAPASGAAVTADRPEASTTIANPDPTQRFHDRMPFPSSLGPQHDP